MQLRPQVKFVFLTDLKGYYFAEYFRELFADFFDWLGEENKRNSESLRKRYDHHVFDGSENGVAMFYVNGRFITHCKAHFLDGENRGDYCCVPEWEDLFCGVIFRNHNEPEHLGKEVFLLSDAFDNFLKEKEVPFQRYNFDSQTGYFLVPNEQNSAT